MVLKNEAARKLKKLRLEGRPERSLFVVFRNGGERDKVVEILQGAHPDIERVFLPRQKLPRKVYVLCKGVNERDGVKDALNNLKTKELGRIKATIPRPKPEKPAVSNVKPEVDRCTLLLEMFPAKMETKVFEEAFPEAEKVDRFNKRRCYIMFNDPKEAMKARVRLSTGDIAGYKFSVKFNKIEKVTVTSEQDDKGKNSSSISNQSEGKSA